LMIFAVTLIGIFYPIIKKKWKEKSVEWPAATVEAPPEAKFRFDRRVLFTVCVIVLLALALWQSRNFGVRAGLFPWVIGTPTLVLALFQLAKDIMGHRKADAPQFEREVGVEVSPRVATRRTLVIIGWTVGFFVMIWLLGFSYAVPLTMVLYLTLAGRESWLTTAIMTFTTWTFFYLLFERALNVPFPEGLLFSLYKGQ
jgi:hypothetical protein